MFALSLGGQIAELTQPIFVRPRQPIGKTAEEPCASAEEEVRGRPHPLNNEGKRRRSLSFGPSSQHAGRQIQHEQEQKTKTVELKIKKKN